MTVGAQEDITWKRIIMCFGFFLQRNQDYLRLIVLCLFEELEGVSGQTFRGHVDPPSLPLQHF